MDDLIADFIADTRVELDRITNLLARFDESAIMSAEDVSELTRGVKTIRANAGVIGLARIAALGDAAEAAIARNPHFDAVRRGVIARVTDRIGRLMAIVTTTGAEPQGGDPDLIMALSEDGEARARQSRLALAIHDEERENGDVWRTIELAAAAAAKQMNKNIAIVIEPSARDLPTPLIYLVRGPLSRVLRFACVYGVELEALRRARGKRAAGAIRVSGLRVGAEFVIAVSDDGAGLDLDRLRTRAVALKLVSRAEAANMSAAAAAALIFAPGLSTFGETSADAGLDRAKAELERLGGAIEVNSLPGRGATFLIRAPIDAEDAPLELMGAAT